MKNRKKEIEMENQLKISKLGLKLKQAREELGLSQKDVAKVVGVDQGKICLTEKGGRKIDAATELPLFAKACKKPIGWFFEEKETSIAKMILLRHPDLKLTKEMMNKFEVLINNVIDLHVNALKEHLDNRG